jgi:hypothetical protein
MRLVQVVNDLFPSVAATDVWTCPEGLVETLVGESPTTTHLRTSSVKGVFSFYDEKFRGVILYVL